MPSKTGRRHLHLVRDETPEPPPDGDAPLPGYTFGRDPGAIMDRLNHPSRAGQEPRVYVTVLGSREAAWNPISTKEPIIGPAKIFYRKYADGGVDAKVEYP